jgi:prepilin-type N-terminal cleavage/methylation domain-containing protein
MRADVTTVMKLSPHSPKTSVRGFSLIEMVGVIAIMSIAAALITPNLARRISRSNGEKEDQALAVLADGLVRSVRATQTIPGTASWATNIAAQVGLSVNDVRYVNPSDTASARVYLIHPAFVPTNSSTTDPLWSQGNSGASSVTNARLLIISTHKSNLTLPVSSGRAASTTAFDNIWNWNFDATTKASPSGWGNAWYGNGEYLHVQRINLAPLFQFATFNNAHHGTNYPYYQVGSSAATAMTATNVISAYFLEGSIMRLYFTNGTTLQMTHSLGNGVNFVYESSRWRIP